MSLFSSSRLGALRVRPLVAVAGVAALLAACGESTTAPAVKAPAEAPSMAVTSTTTPKILRYTEKCTGTTCTFDASVSSGFWGFTWIFIVGSTNKVVVGTVATYTFPANGAFPVVLRASHSSGTGQVMKNVICTNGVCF